MKTPKERYLLVGNEKGPFCFVFFVIKKKVVVVLNVLSPSPVSQGCRISCVSYVRFMAAAAFISISELSLCDIFCVEFMG